jgi:ADP-ribose pyrophosphatase
MMGGMDRIIERERIIEARVFDVDRVVLAEGGERQVVVHGGSVVVLPILDDGRIVLIRNDRFAVGSVLWELCAGTLEDGEEPLAAAGRELVEETGYQAARIEPLCGFYTCPGFCTEYLHCFLATGLRHIGQKLDSGEKIEVQALPPPRVLGMIRAAEICDGKTIAAVLHWWTFVHGR